MQTANANPNITVTVRHETVTDSLRDYALKKIEGIHLDYPRIIEAKAILDVQKNRHVAEIILFCANHITIDASSETEDMYKSIDETIDKIARRMRKHKTRLLKKHRPRPEDTIKHLAVKGIKNLLVIAPGFSADCLETLEEIGLRACDDFCSHGGENFSMVPCLNDSDMSINMLARIAGEELSGWG